MPRSDEPHDRWQAIEPRRQPPVDARLQLHHAAQFSTALGISFLTPQADDSHTNLGWDARFEALVSRAARTSAGQVAIGTRPRDLTLLLLDDGACGHTIPMHGRTIEDVAAEVRSALDERGLDGTHYSLKRHYDLPPHAVARGAPFNAASHGDFAFLAGWLANASLELGRVATANAGASEVRLWPHHFDIATLITAAPGRSSGAGLSMGDGYYPEPYFYVTAHPEPSAEALTAPLDGGGSWHTHEWIGAVLPVSRVGADSGTQQTQVRAFLTSAVAACRVLVSP